MKGGGAEMARCLTGCLVPAGQSKFNFFASFAPFAGLSSPSGCLPSRVYRLPGALLCEDGPANRDARIAAPAVNGQEQSVQQTTLPAEAQVLRHGM